MRNILISVISCTIIYETFCDDINGLKFPPGFKFGAGTSAYQTEGAWNVSDKGENVLDRWTHENSAYVTDGTNGDIACDSYHKYKEDVALMKTIGFDYYRFSISWTRILPTGFANKVSEDGIRHYKNLIKELLENGIEPIVTICHFDQPQLLEDMGGWTNRLMVDWFADYARIIFREFGHMVKTFITFNEPAIMCAGYRSKMMAPGKEILNVGFYQCIHNALKAHATAYHIYDEEFRPHQHGQIGLTHYCRGLALGNTHDVISAEIAFQFGCGCLVHPIYLGDYSDVVKERVALVSKAQGYKKSRLPVLSPEWISYIKGTSDFFGVNHYTSVIATLDPDELRGKHNNDEGLLYSVDPRWINGTFSWLKVVPEGFRKLLRKIKTDYNNPPIWVIENGYSDWGELEDYNRINYIHAYLKAMMSAIYQDGCRVLRYTVWSLLDNYELHDGYTQHFGIVKVDFNSSNRERTPKLSALWFKELIRTHKLQDVPLM